MAERWQPRRGQRVRVRRWQPRQGERVRVRAGLAGTCRGERASPRRPGDLAGRLPGRLVAVIGRLVRVSGHRAQEEGRVGTVLAVDPAATGAHGVLVRFDEPVRIGWVPGWAQRPDRMYYAPSELARVRD